MHRRRPATPSLARSAGARGLRALAAIPLLAAASCPTPPTVEGPGGDVEAAEADAPAPVPVEEVAPTAAEREGPAEPPAMRVARARLVEQLRAKGITDPRVLDAVGRVKRHRLVPLDLREHAYEDRALPIGHGQTISQPFVVALMSQLLDVQPGEKVLEIGTGSGYQAAILAELGARVLTIEIVRPLGERARRDLDALGYEGVRTRVGDGYVGWPEEAPFDGVVLTAAPPEVPAPLVEQLAVGGRLVAPVGVDDQRLVVMTRRRDGVVTDGSIGVRFVPMTGRAQDPAP